MKAFPPKNAIAKTILNKDTRFLIAYLRSSQFPNLAWCYCYSFLGIIHLDFGTLNFENVFSIIEGWSKVLPDGSVLCCPDVQRSWPRCPALDIIKQSVISLTSLFIIRSSQTTSLRFRLSIRALGSYDLHFPIRRHLAPTEWRC